MQPTLDWMRKAYDEANEKYFNGRLGDCNFDTHRSATNTLGFFNMRPQGKLMANRYSRQMSLNGKEIDRDNFFELAKPFISLNLNYESSEEAWFNTMVHEMCHYYTYQDGRAPKQGHGPEFRRIAELVDYRSNGEMKIGKVDRTGLHVMNAEVKQKRDDARAKRQSTAITNARVLLGKDKTGRYSLCIPQTERIRNMVFGSWKHYVYACREEIWESNDETLKSYLLTHGYQKARTEIPATYTIHAGCSLLNNLNMESVDEFIRRFFDKIWG